MAVDYFLKIDGIEGESQDAKHKGEIQLLSWSWGVNQTGTMAAGGGGGAGKANFSDFNVSKGVDKASPGLLRACATGQHVKSAIMTARKAGKEQQEYLKITLSDLLVTSVQIAAGGAEVPAESVGLNYSKVEVEYKEQKADGSLGGGIKMHWDLKQTKGG